MSTWARITVKMSDGTYKATRVTFDGQLSGVGRCLLRGVRNQQAAEEIVSHGLLASIVEHDGSIVFVETMADFHGAGKETNPQSATSKRLTKIRRLLWSEYNYHWNGENWMCECHLFDEPMPLTEDNTK